MVMDKILVIDNYDSFTWNLVHAIETLTGSRPDVYRNDELDLGLIAGYDRIILSPGPGLPEDAGICLDLIREYARSKSILGVCLGHQAIGEAFGARLVNLENVFHGVAAPVKVTDPSEKLFRELPGEFTAGRYHSWVVEKESLPGCFTVTCVGENGLIMGISHKEYDVRGVQFHPESVLTQYGTDILRNWIGTSVNMNNHC